MQGNSGNYDARWTEHADAGFKNSPHAYMVGQDQGMALKICGEASPSQPDGAANSASNMHCGSKNTNTAVVTSADNPWPSVIRVPCGEALEVEWRSPPASTASASSYPSKSGWELEVLGEGCSSYNSGPTLCGVSNFGQGSGLLYDSQTGPSCGHRVWMPDSTSQNGEKWRGPCSGGTTSVTPE
jgi:hypothetical protein